MGITSLQVCMDSTDDWLQGSISEEVLEDQTLSSDQDILVACSGTLMERRLIRPQHEQSPKCPRCDSTHTKFCYYNNYSLSQPRYFCKTCRRYWTKGGTLRNIPVGGGCRKNSSKKTSSGNSKKNDSSNGEKNNDNVSPGGSALMPAPSSSSLCPSNDLINGLTCYNYVNAHAINPSAAFFPEMPFAQLSSNNALGFLSCDAANAAFVLESSSNNNTAPINFMMMESNNYNKFEGAFVEGVSDNAIGEGMMMNSYGNANYNLIQAMTSTPLHHGVGMTSAANNDDVMVDNFQRMTMPYDQNRRLVVDDGIEDVKAISTARVLPLQWNDNYNHYNHRITTEMKDQNFGYNLGGLGPSWTSLMNGGGGGHGSSATNPLV